MPTVVGLFRSSMELDKAVNQLLSSQYLRDQLAVLPLHKTEAAPRPKGILGWFMRGGVFGDTLDRTDGTSVMDGVAAGATLGGLAGVIAGAAWQPGPITLGAGGILGGGFLGWLLDRVVPENRRQEYDKALRKSSTLVLVRCARPERAAEAQRILRENQAHEIG